MLKRVKIFNKIFLVLIAAVVVSIAPFATASADILGTGKCYTTTTTINKKTGKKKTTKTWNNAYEGYFTQKCASKTWEHQGNVINGGVSASSAKALIKQMHGWYDGGGQNKVGAAFIVKTMLGKDSKGGGKTIKQSEWDDVEARIKALDSSGKIDWSASVDRCTTNSYYQSENKDDSFYKRDSGCGKDPAIKFKGGYVLDKKCANPLGSLDQLPEPDWKISVKSSVKSVSSLLPGGKITWEHTATNSGPDDTTQDVDYRYENNGALGGGHGSDHTLSEGTKKNDSKDFTSTYTITSNDAGNKLCRATSAAPKSWNSSSRTTSSDACVDIPYKYTLTPFITSSVSGTIEANTPFTVTPSVTNTGPTRSKPTQWQITQIVVVPSGTVPNEAGGNSPQLPCGTYFLAMPDASCSTVQSGNTVFNSDGTRQSGTVLSATAITAGDYEVGTKLCYAYSIQPRSDSDDQWAHSEPVCMIIGKKPKVQVIGGDLISGGLIQTSTSNKNIGGTNRMFGSWDEYALFATSSITGMGSGAAFAGPGMVNPTTCKYSTLSFTNSGATVCTPTTQIGNYAIDQSMPDVASSFPVNTDDLSRNLGNNVTVDLSVNNLQGVYRASGNVTINGGGAGKVIKKGQWIVINAPTANVTINDNINYTDETLKTIDEIPQVVIIANNINILGNVTNVDAWLVASNNINTCASVAVAAPLWAGPSGKCDQQLTVNGPVMAQKLYLRRTAGSGVGNASGDPAEVVNLRADAYLWSMTRANSNGHVQTVDTIELPPRF